MLDRAIGLLGIALALIFGLWSLAPEGWPKMPPWAVYLGVAIGIFMIGVAGGMVASEYRKGETEAQRFPKWPEPYHAISVAGKKFRNERVPLDGYAYSDCEFYNVQFIYNGTTTIQFSHNKIFGQLVIGSDNIAVLGAWAMTVGFNLLKEEVQILDLPPTNTLERGNQMPTK